MSFYLNNKAACAFSFAPIFSRLIQHLKKEMVIKTNADIHYNLKQIHEIQMKVITKHAI